MGRVRTTHEFSNLVRGIRKKHTGIGPEEITTRFVDNCAICQMRGNMSHFEKFICRTDEGKKMIHHSRTEFIKKIYEDQEVIAPMEKLTDAKFIALFTDFNVDLDLAYSIYVFDKHLKDDVVDKP